MTSPDIRYLTLRAYFRTRFGDKKVNKVSLNPSLGCPNRDEDGNGCIFCQPKTLIPKDHDKDWTIAEQLKAGIEKVGKRENVTRLIAHLQIDTNTNAPIEKLRELYNEATDAPRIEGLVVSTRPDCVAEPVMELLSEFNERGEFWLELGLQSANNKTLERINRGHTAEDFADAVIRADSRNIKVCAHIIIGLPGESRDDYLSTIRFIAALPVWGVKFHQLQVTKDTILEREYNEGLVELLTLEEYIDLVIDSLELLPPDMVIHRVVGDTLDKFHIAPRWGPDKFRVIEMIKARFIERDTRQGAKYRDQVKKSIANNHI
jgi:radical SAM protein (TIGR01212 family)